METQRRVYLDHAAASPLREEVEVAMRPYWSQVAANPSAIHSEGLRAAEALQNARATIATVIGARGTELLFVSGGTEADNLAIIGVVEAYRAMHPGRVPHVVTSQFEHEAILVPLALLESEGKVVVTRILPGSGGVLRVEDVLDALTTETVLVTLMAVQNEIGTIQPIREIAKGLRKWRLEHGGPTRDERAGALAQYPYFHTDACQYAAYGELSVGKLGVDLMTVNAGKIGGPKGVGLLYVRTGVALRPLLSGGGQEGGKRAGTENVPGIVGFAEALRLATTEREAEVMRVTELRDLLLSGLREIVPNLIVNGSMVERSPANLNVSIPGCDHEFLAIGLDSKGVAVATKSACSELGDTETSHVLVALREADGTPDFPASGIRMTLGRMTTTEDITWVLEVWKKLKEGGNYIGTGA